MAIEDKDLGIKIGSKMESFWTSRLNAVQNEIKGAKEALIYLEAIEQLCKDKVAQEAL